VPALLDALKAGRVDGSVYRASKRVDGKCCGCLVGSLEIARAERLGIQLDAGTDFVPDECDVVERDAGRPAERWFLGIRLGDTPEKSTVAKWTVEAVEEFQRLVAPVTAAVKANETRER
jgi:hypothetical protein